MKRYLRDAAKAWAGATLNIKRFADAYVGAVRKFGEVAIEKFGSSYPMFGEREWRRLKWIGEGTLLPQFFFKSDFFVGKLLKLNSSMRIQKALVGASNDGRIRVDRGKGPEKIAIADLTRDEDRALVMLLSEENEKLSSAELRSKYRFLVAKINRSNRRRRPKWEIKTVGGRTVARFNRACNLEKSEVEEVLDAVSRGQSGKAAGRTSREILDDLVKAIQELESNRDTEWNFIDACGHDSAFWTDSDQRQHDWILECVQASRDEVQRLAREATGDKKLEI